MAKQKTLLEGLARRRTLRRAWDRLNKRNPQSRGISDETIQAFAGNLYENIGSVRASLLRNEYRFAPVRGVLVPKPGKSELRPIRVAEVRDRLVGNALASVIREPLSVAHEIENRASFAYIEGFGVRDAIARMVELFEVNRWVFEADLQDFFGSINRKKLLEELVFPCLRDGTLNGLLEDALNQQVGNLDEFKEDDAYYFNDSGIPQGGSLSPLFANVYLASFDKEMLDGGHQLIRYADDFVVMCRTEAEAIGAFEESQKLLEGDLGLTMHPLVTPDEIRRKKLDRRTVKTTMHPIQEGLFFLGVRFDGERLTPAPKKIAHFKERIREVTDVRLGYERPENVVQLLVRVRNTLQGWITSFAHTGLEPLLPELDELIDRRLGVGLKKLGWKLEGGETLSELQRENSGIPKCIALLENARRRMKEKHAKVFRRFWAAEPTTTTLAADAGGPQLKAAKGNSK